MVSLWWSVCGGQSGGFRPMRRRLDTASSVGGTSVTDLVTKVGSVTSLHSSIKEVITKNLEANSKEKAAADGKLIAAEQAQTGNVGRIHRVHIQTGNVGRIHRVHAQTGNVGRRQSTRSDRKCRSHT